MVVKQEEKQSDNRSTKLISQLKFSKGFLEKLLSKLTIGNGRSIHLNAVPGKLKTRLDVTDLAITEENKKEDATARDFLNDLLTKDKFSFKISWNKKNQNNMSDDVKQKLHIVTKRLDSIVVDNEDMYLETGIRNFGFGFPLLVKPDIKDSKKVIIAPIFIWSLDIEKSNVKNEWIISKNEDSPIKVNELLASHIENDENIKIPQLTSVELDDNVLSQQEIMDYIAKLFKVLGVKEVPTNFTLDKCPTKDTIESITGDKAWVQWSGVFGLYRSQKESIIESTRELLNNIDKFNAEDLEIEPFQTSTTSSFDMDPSQSEIINTLNNDEFKIIQGPPGTGKSQAISAIISNALANGAKTLVVCEKKTALDVLANNLEKKNLDTFCIVVDDSAKDRRAIVTKARDLQEYGVPYIKGFDKDAFEKSHDSFIKLRNEINAAYNESSRPIFAGDNWKEIVGKYLKYSKSENFDAVKDKFAKLKFAFNPEEMRGFIDKIRAGEALYEQLSDVNEEVFYILNFADFGENVTIKDKNEIKSRIEKSKKIIEDALKYIQKESFVTDGLSIASKTKRLTAEIENAVSCSALCDYARKFQKQTVSRKNTAEFLDKLEEFNDFVKKLSPVVNKVEVDDNLLKKLSIIENTTTAKDKINELYASGTNLVGDKFNNKKIGIISRLFSSAAVEATAVLSEIKTLFEKIKYSDKELNEYLNIQINLRAWDEYATISDSMADIKKLCTEISHSQDKMSKYLFDIAEQICSQSISLDKYKKTCEDIIECKNFIWYADEAIVRIFPNVRYLKGEYENIKEYETVLNKLSHDLDALYDNLQSVNIVNSWIKYRDSEKALFSILLKLPPREWEEVFTGAYYYNFLLDFEANSKSGLPRNDSKLKLLRKLYNELQEQTIKKIYDYWYEERANAIEKVEYKYGFKSLFALKKNQKFGKRLSLRQIIQKDFKSFTSLFPVIMVNPIVANELLPLKQGLFDLVIFDEASQLRVEDVYTAMIRGKYKIIAGDRHQMPPSNYFAAGIDGIADTSEEDDDTEVNAKIGQGNMLDAESLLEFSEYLEKKNMSYLDFHYRSKHPALIEFSNTAFYGRNLCPLPVNGEDYTPIILKEVNGIYESGKGRNINKEEAFEVVKMLAEMPENPDGTMPSVGVATFNIHQRNCIIDLLYETAQEKPEFAEKYDKLKKSGLFVKNLENIQGDERDIIIISTTFGLDENGRFYERFATIGQSNGYKLINVLITRAKKKLYVVTSIPKSYYSRYKEEIEAKQENNRKAILYAYLSYAKAISDKNIEAANAVLQDLCKFSMDRPRLNQNEVDSAHLTDSSFEQEVYDEICKFIDSKLIIPQYKIGGYRLDFLININGHKIALECDGKAYHSTPQAYAADMNRQKQIEQFGYEFYRIWSTNWFEDKDREILKFRRFIEGLK